MISITRSPRFLSIHFFLFTILVLFAPQANTAKAQSKPNYTESKIRDYYLPDIFLVPNQKKVFSSLLELLGSSGFF